MIFEWYSQETNMSPENQWMEDLFPIEPFLWDILL